MDIEMNFYDRKKKFFHSNMVIKKEKTNNLINVDLFNNLKGIVNPIKQILDLTHEDLLLENPNLVTDIYNEFKHDFEFINHNTEIDTDKKQFIKWNMDVKNNKSVLMRYDPLINHPIELYKGFPNPLDYPQHIKIHQDKGFEYSFKINDNVKKTFTLYRDMNYCSFSETINKQEEIKIHLHFENNIKVIQKSTNI